MLDPFSGRPTFIRGANLPSASDQSSLVQYHERRLEAFACLCAAATECGITTDPDRHLLLLSEDEIEILRFEGGAWAKLYEAIKAIRDLLPLVTLEKFGFPDQSDDPFNENSTQLTRIGVGMEAWAFQAGDGSIYKFFLPRISYSIGAIFHFRIDEDHKLLAESNPYGSYCDLLRKLCLLNVIGGMPTEVIGISPEGVLIAKQAKGQLLPDGTETSELLDISLIVWPSRFLSCDRKHPRLVFVNGEPWLVADLHERNIVLDSDGRPRIIDLVSAPLPRDMVENFPLLRGWIEQVRRDPAASLLGAARDEEL